jgi:hypothetical protein
MQTVLLEYAPVPVWSTVYVLVVGTNPAYIGTAREHARVSVGRGGHTKAYGEVELWRRGIYCQFKTTWWLTKWTVIVLGKLYAEMRSPYNCTQGAISDYHYPMQGIADPCNNASSYPADTDIIIRFRCSWTTIVLLF